MLTLNLEAAKQTEALIEVAGGSFAFLLNPPTFQDRLTDDAFITQMYRDPESYTQAFKGRATAQLNRVVGWKDLDGSDGKPMPFTRENLTAILSKFPAILSQLSLALVRLYSEAMTWGSCPRV